MKEKMRGGGRAKENKRMDEEEDEDVDGDEE